ncbi:MAG: hypothetical protein PHS16_02645 [Candidatus Colwellbacteria bacterium]|jgi:hypothetical protein|nr:hypothetical protein [Candidatus Colwellbacteria bacterium]MCK9497658.1 hypothetical protein [Candidatus Colwellbacteria bacterium]MDD3752804.1 hypothetical protein [Candidatus Colwellbacteria bacterium]MDD4818924.1 hypothetical protein [Candidatus Colwellbacteria bacterium]
MDTTGAIQKVIEAFKDAGQYIIPAVKALLNVFALIFETLANLIRDGLGKM